MKKQTLNLASFKSIKGWRFCSSILALLVLLLVLFPGNQALAAKSYKMEQVSITADLAADGSMAVTEERTYRFKGRFKYAFRTFPLNTGAEYADFRVSENNQAYLLSDSKEPGTYTVTTKDQEIEVRWFYRAKRETRTFVLDYKVGNAVLRYMDSAVLYYKFIGDGFGKSTGNVDITVNPPVPVDQWQIRQWAHGPLWGSSETSGTGIVTATCENLPKKRFFELRVLYPVEIFGDAPQKMEYIVSEVTAEEETWANAAHLLREEAHQDSVALKKRMSIGVWALPLLVLLFAAWFYRIVRQYGTRPTVPAVPSSSPEIPSDLPPALVGYLIDERTVNASAIMATLMDLARRGFLEFREEQELGKDFLGREKWEATHSWLLKKDHYREQRHQLAGFEDMLVKFVFEDLASDQTTGSAMVIVNMERFKKEKSKVERFFGQWTKVVKAEADKHEFFDQASFKGRNQGIWLGAGLTVLALPMIPLVHALALIPAVAGITMVVGSTAIVHHTREGLIQDKKWKSLRKFLKKKGFQSSEPTTVLEFIEPYFIYGVIMGMTKGQLESLGSMIPVGKSIYFMPWYVSRNSDGGFVGGSFGESFSASVASVNSAMSSSTGAGGGASGGGGGGSGGGGGGAG